LHLHIVVISFYCDKQDIVLLCQNCMVLVHNLDNKLKQELSDEYNLARLEDIEPKFSINKQCAKVRSCARALLKNPSNIPKEREEELKKVVRAFFDKDEIDLSDLTEAADQLEWKTQNLRHVSHGKAVVQNFTTYSDFLSFVKRWRQHFLTEMKPQFLPQYWSIDHPLVNENNTHKLVELFPNEYPRQEVL